MTWLADRIGFLEDGHLTGHSEGAPVMTVDYFDASWIDLSCDDMEVLAAFEALARHTDSPIEWDPAE